MNSLARWNGKVAVVTGASSGVGAAIVKRLVDSGIKVVGLARRKEKMEELSKELAGKSGKFYVHKADLTIEDDVLKAFQWIKENLGPVHILINSAGVHRLTSLMDGNTQMWKDILDTNILALCMVTRETCRSMRLNNVNGHIIHINCIRGHRVLPHPNNNVYPASKFAVTALTETLRQELNFIGSKTKITSISPAGVDSDFFRAAQAASGANFASASFTSFTSREGIYLKPENVADAITYVLSTPPFVQIHELIIHSINEHF